MTDTWRIWWQRITTGSRRVRLWVVLGLVGIGLIALSEWLPHSAKEEPSAASETKSATVPAWQVEQAMEERITQLLSAVEGVGNCQVMVTLESDTQAVYAVNTATSSQANAGQSASEQYLTVDTEQGPAGLLLTHLQPTIKGVAVVCGGGNDPVVCQRVIDVVTTAFHISERRVCVVKQQ